MIEICRVYAYCKDDDISLIENYDKAIADTTQTWICHHRDEVKVLPSGIKVYRSVDDLIENGRYYHCPANELIFLTKEEHNKLHFNDKKHTKAHNNAISNGLKGHIRSDFGKLFKEHFGIERQDNIELYKKEYKYFYRHNKCRWN